LKARLATLVAVLGLFMLAIGLLGIMAARDGNTRMKSIFEDRTVPLAQLSEIDERMKKNTIILYEAATNSLEGAAGDVAGRIKNNSEAIDKIWAEYMSTFLTPEEKVVAQSFIAARKTYLEQGIKPAFALLNEGKLDQMVTLLGKSGKLLRAAMADMEKLVAIQVKEAKADFEATQSQYVVTIVVAVGLLALGLVLGGLLGLQTIRAIVRPLGRLNEAMLNITQAKLDTRILVDCDDETGVALRNL
jgi:methyl-accepting chemotaxis protein